MNTNRLKKLQNIYNSWNEGEENPFPPYPQNSTIANNNNNTKNILRNLNEQLKTPGLILVFDMDATIINESEPVVFNMNIVALLEKAARLRGRGVDAICLLTNNSDSKFIKNVDSHLLYMIKSAGRLGRFFDYTMDRNHATRSSMTKSFKDIKTMARHLRIPYSSEEQLMRRTFFFDDQQHVLQQEMKGMFPENYSEHYVKITPPFVKGDEIDKTDFTAVNYELDRRMPTEGGRKTRKARRNRRKTRKSKK